MKRMIISLLLGAVLLLLPFALQSQETAFSYTTESTPKDIRVNSQGRTVFLSYTFHEFMTVTCLNFFDLDNVVHTRVIYPGLGQLKSALFGNSVAIAYLDIYSNGFYWLTYSDSISNPVESPHIVTPPGMFIIGVSQIDEEYCAVLFSCPNGNYAVYYLDADANIIWSCEIPTTEGGLNDGTNALYPRQFAMLDSTNFVIIADTNDWPTFMHVMRFDNTGARTSDTMITSTQIGLARLNQTTVPGVVLMNYFVGGNMKVDKIDNLNIENVITINNAVGINYGTAVVADSSYITMFCNFPGPNLLNLLRYNWSGSLVSQNMTFQTLGTTQPDWCALTPVGNYVCAIEQTGSFNLRRVLASDFTVGNDESVNPPGSLLSVYPNPFRSNLTLRLELKTPLSVEVKIFNLKGQLVKELSTLQGKAGQNEISWDGTDVQNRPVTNGIYFIKAQAGENHYMRKCLKLDKTI